MADIRRKGKLRLRGRSRIGKIQGGGSPRTSRGMAKPADKSSYDGTGQQGGQAWAPPSAGDSIQPDFMNDAGGVGDDPYGPQMPTNEEGGYGDDPYGPQQPEVDDKDNSNAQENGVNDQGGVGNDPYGPSLAEAEKNANTNDGQDTSGNLNREGFANDPNKSAWENATDQSKRNAEIKIKNRGFRSKKGVFAIVGTVGITLTVVGAIFTIPQLALNNALDKLTGRMSDRVSHAVEKRFEKYVGLYVTKSVVPSMDTCGAILKPDCNKVNRTDGIVSRAITGWNDARLESRLDTKHGITFQKDTKDPSAKVEIFKDGKSIGTVDNNTSIRQLREKIKLETKNDEVIKRRHLKSVGDRYGLQWCASFKLAEGICDVQNKGRDAKGNVLSAFKRKKLQLAARVVSPAGARGAAFMLCLMEGCSPENVASAGFEESKRLFKNADGPELTRLIEKVGDRRISQFITEEAIEKTLSLAFRGTLEKVAVQSAARSAASAIPFVGWVYLGATILDIADRLDKFVEKGGVSEFIYDRNVQASLAYTSTMVSSIEESRSFDVPIEEQGATLQLLEQYNQSRYYQTLTGQEPNNSLECANEYVITADSNELVCPEVVLRREVGLEQMRQNPYVNAIIEAGFSTWRSCAANLVLPGIGTLADFALNYLPGECKPKTGEVVSKALQVVNAGLGFVGDIVFSVVEVIPGVSQSIEALSKASSSALSGVVDSILPLAVKADAVGWLAFDQMAAGFDYMYKFLLGGYEDENGQFQGFGAGEINSVDAGELDLAIAGWRGEELQNQSFYAKYLDPNNYDSLAVSSLVRLSSFLPFTGGTFTPGVNLTNMFGSVGNIFTGSASAQSSTVNIFDSKHFGNTEVAFTLAQLETNPEDLTDEFCAEEKANFKEARKNGVQASSLCMLDEAVVDIVTKALNPDEPNTTSGSFGPGVASAGDYIWPIQSTENRVTACWNEDRTGFRAGYFHSGLDISAAMGAPVLATTNGVVTVKRVSNSGVGNTLVIKHDDGLYSQYQHLLSFDSEQGDRVAKGEQIGTADSTGFSFGSHLHFNIQTVDGVQTRSDNTLNPLDYLPPDSRTKTYTRSGSFPPASLQGTTVTCVPSSIDPLGWRIGGS